MFSQFAHSLHSGILQGSTAARDLRVRMAALLPEVTRRIQHWWEKVSLGKVHRNVCCRGLKLAQVWMTLSKFGFNSDHLKRMVITSAGDERVMTSMGV